MKGFGRQAPAGSQLQAGPERTAGEGRGEVGRLEPVPARVRVMAPVRRATILTAKEVAELMALPGAVTLH